MSRLAGGAKDLALVAAAKLLTITVRRIFGLAPESEAPKAAASPVRPPSGSSTQSPTKMSEGSPARSGTVPATDKAEKEHGRHSASPFQIPRRGWIDILWRTYQQIGEDRLLAIAAGVVFFGLLAVFPTITALVALYGLFADPSTIGKNLQSLSLMLPEGSFQIVQDQISRVLSKGNTSLGLTFLFGLGLALWSANAGVKAIIDALNVVYSETEKRGFFKLNAISLLFTISGIAAILQMVGMVVALPLVLNHLWMREYSKTIVSLSRWPLLLVMIVLGLGVLYRFGPSRPGARWEWISVGAVVAALFWLAGSSLLSWYLSSFGDYNATYGSLGAAIGLMMWMWMSAIIVLCGAELNSEIEHQTELDTTDGHDKPMGERGATMADTVGAAQN